MARTVFISYRRSDELDAVRRMRDKLALAFGSAVVFKDEDSIHPGDDYPTVIQSSVARCRVLVVAIGPGWVDASDDQPGRRLLREDDWVRQEIAAGLSSRRTRVIPVLLEDAPMPKVEQLPSSIQALATQQNIIVSRADIDQGCVDLVLAIERLGVPRQEDPRRARLLTVAAAVVAVIAVAAFVLTRLDQTQRSGRDETASALAVPAGGGSAGPVKPKEMLGDFNVAVADFTSDDPKDQVEAGLLAKQLADRLQKTFEAAPGAGWDIEVRGPEEIGAIGGTTKGEREAAAKQLATQIKANVVIGATVSFTGPSSIQPIVFLNPERLADNPELGGIYEFTSITSRGSYTNPRTKKNLLSGLSDTTEAVQQFLDGVSSYTFLDDPESAASARASFTAALASGKLPPAAQEGAHAFLGSLSLLAGDKDAARVNYEAAIEVNRRSFRGRLGLAELGLLASVGQRCGPGTVSERGLADAAASFAAVGADDPDELSGIKARLGVARAQRCQSQAGIAVDEVQVEQALRSVVADVQGLPDGRREAAQELEAAAHAELALLVAPEVGRPDPEALEESLAESQLAVDRSTRPKNQAIYLWQVAFYAEQLGRTDAARQALAKAAEADPSFAAVTVDMLVPQGSAKLVPSGVGAPTSVLPGGLLVQTGASVRAPLGLGLVLLAAGALLIAWARRLQDVGS